MRQFTTILLVIYLVLGVGTGVVYYGEGQKHARPETGSDQLALEAAVVAVVAVAWPFHILDILAGHDAR